MTDDFDTHVTAALRTLERDPVDDGRDSVARRVRRRRVRGVAGAAALALVVGIGIGAVLSSNDSSRKVDVQQPGPPGPTAPPISATATGVLTWPTTVAAGDQFSAVLRNPLSGPNTSCFIVVRLERWDGDAWGEPRELLPEGVDPNLAGPGANCQPDLIQPSSFIGERKYTVPADLASGDYRIVETSTEGEGRIAVLGPNQVAASEPRPSGQYSIDLAPGGGLDDTSTPATLDRDLRSPPVPPKAAVLLDDDRLAIAWRSACNSPARRIDFDYGADRVTARLEIGSFVVKDCVGESDRLSTIVDLPAPLWGRELDVVAGSDSERASRVDVTPLSTFVLPETPPESTSPPVFATTILRQTAISGGGRIKPGTNPNSISIGVYGGACLDNAQSAVYAADDGVIYVQPRAQVSGHAALCGQWQFFQVPARLPPDSHFFALTGIT